MKGIAQCILFQKGYIHKWREARLSTIIIYSHPGCDVVIEKALKCKKKNEVLEDPVFPDE